MDKRLQLRHVRSVGRASCSVLPQSNHPMSSPNKKRTRDAATKKTPRASRQKLAADDAKIAGGALSPNYSPSSPTPSRQECSSTVNAAEALEHISELVLMDMDLQHRLSEANQKAVLYAAKKIREKHDEIIDWINGAIEKSKRSVAAPASSS